MLVEALVLVEGAGSGTCAGQGRRWHGQRWRVGCCCCCCLLPVRVVVVVAKVINRVAAEVVEMHIVGASLCLQTRSGLRMSKLCNSSEKVSLVLAICKPMRGLVGYGNDIATEEHVRKLVAQASRRRWSSPLELNA